MHNGFIPLSPFSNAYNCLPVRTVWQAYKYLQPPYKCNFFQYQYNFFNIYSAVVAENRIRHRFFAVFRVLGQARRRVITLHMKG
jgi:hypothetical protein